MVVNMVMIFHKKKTFIDLTILVVSSTKALSTR